MTLSGLIELLQEIMEEEGDIEVVYAYNDNGYLMEGESVIDDIEVRQDFDGKVAVIW